jgi:predicted alpha/beta hydrolase
MQEINLETSDGQVLSGLFYPSKQPKATLLIGSALGVPQQFYKHFAAFMATQGFQCLSFDYRGTGLSHFKGRAGDIQLADWGRLDLEAGLQKAKQLATENGINTTELYYVGHSIGGQLLGLAKSSVDIKASMLVGASAPYWARWPYPRKFFMSFVCFGLLPLLSFSRQMFPAKAVGLSSMDIPAGCARDWGKWMRDPDYLFAKKFKLATQGYQDVSGPILSLCFDDDDFAPPKNVNYLLTFFSGARIQNELVQHQHINLGSIDHMGFFKKKFEHTLWLKSVDHFAQDASVQRAN